MHTLIEWFRQCWTWFHWIYNVRGVIEWGGLTALVVIIFSETGLLAGFFLPGDSLLVTAGVFCTSRPPEPPLLNAFWVLALCSMAAVLGDQVGYWFGAKTGPKIFTREDSIFFHKKHLIRTQRFYEKHGGKTIVIARFMPIVRTFAPLVAGVGQMRYRRFVSYNVFGGIGWIFAMVLLGYSLGTIWPDITKSIDKVIVVVIAVSLMPGAISWYLNRGKHEDEAAAPPPPAPGT